MKSKQSVPEFVMPSNPEDLQKEMDAYLDRINPSTSAYRGNTLIKRAGEKIEWTPWMIQEWIKCSEDPIYFIEKYVKIVHLDHGIVPFLLWNFQKDMVRSMWLERKTIIATARQVGKCCCKDTIVRIKNKKTGEIMTMPIGDFHRYIKSKTDV